MTLAAATGPDSPYAVDVSAGSEWMREFAAAGESDLACGVFDPEEVRAALGTDEVEFEGSAGVEADPPPWQCRVTFPSGSLVTLSLETGDDGVEAFTRQVDTAAMVSLGSSFPGMVLREWSSENPRLGGYFYVSCGPSEQVAVVGTGADNTAVGDEPDHAQLATVFTLAGSAMREALDCGGPLPLPDELPED